MWHEARKQERKIRGMLVDYRKRAERRQDFYEKIKADPTQFMQIHGRKCKIHLDPVIAAAGDSPAIMMPWQGQQDNMIDRFDVRAHLDYIAPVSKPTAAQNEDDMVPEERQCNYERYRILAQNDFIGISEEKFLNQLYLEEQFGVNAQLELERASSKKNKSGGAAIGYTYEDSDPIQFSQSLQNIQTTTSTPATSKDELDSDSDLDVDVAIDISKLDTSQAHELNACGRGYGMKSNDFYSFLTKDADEAETLRMAREEEAEKILLSGRKSRRERRAQRDKRLPGRTLSPPSYAAKEEPDFRMDDEKNESDSRSPTPDNSGKVIYITSFGGEDELQPHSKISINFNNSKQAASNYPENSLGNLTYADKVKQNLEKLKKINNMSGAKDNFRRRMSRSYSRSRSRSRSRRRFQRRRSRSPRRRSRRRSGSRDRYHRRRSRSNHRRSRRYSSSSRSRSPILRKQKSSSPSPQPSIQVPQVKLEVKSPIIMNQSPVKKIIIKKSRSKSPVKEKVPIQVPELIAPKEEPPPIKRYYGRRKEDQTSSEEDEEEVENNNENEVVMGSPKSDNNTQNSPGLLLASLTNTMFGKPTVSAESKSDVINAITTAATSALSGASKTTVNPRDRLKKKMQILLNKQFRADKKAEIERTERQIQQQQEREDEMRELALKLRRRQRELRHKYGTPTSSQSGSKSKSRSNSKSVEKSPKISKRKSRSSSKCRARSHSRSPRLRSRSTSRSRNYRKTYNNDRNHDRSRDRERLSRERDRDRYRGRISRERVDRRPTDRRSKSRSRTGGRDWDRDRERERDRDRNRDRDRDRERENIRDRDNRERDRFRERINDRINDRTGDRDKDRERDRREIRGDRDRERIRDGDRGKYVRSPKKLVDY